MNKKTTITEDDSFVVEITEQSDELIVTSNKSFTNKLLQNAISSYSNGNGTYSDTLSETLLMKTTLTEDKIATLAFQAQDNLSKIQEINTYIDFYLNKDDIIGKTYEIIEANTNDAYQLSYPVVKGRNKEVILNKAKSIIDNFNEQIELSELIIETIPYAYSTGNRTLYLREIEKGKYQVDRYPLGVIQYSNLKVNNEPVALFSIPDMLGRLTGQDFITPYGTNVTNIYSGYNKFPNLDTQIKSSFPKEIYDEYKLGRNTIVQLDTDKTGVIRVNNRGKKYGLSPIFKALTPALRLDIQEKSDSSNSKARGKKIIFQRITDKLLGDDANNVDLGLPVYSHTELIKALKNEVAVYTGAPWVTSIEYVEPKIDNAVTDNLNYYKTKVLSALGISFLNGDSKTGMVVSQLNFTELMRVIDKIAKQLEHNLHKWYQYILVKEGIPSEYAPKIKVIDSELMELELRMALSEKLFNSFGASFKTVYEMLGLDYQDEVEKRKVENSELIDEKVFYPRMNANTYSAKGDEDYANENVDNKDKQNKTVNQTVKDGAKDD